MKVLLTALWPVGGIRTFLKYVYGSAHFEDVELTLVAPDSGLSAYLDANLPVDRIRLVPCEQSAKSLLSVTRSVLTEGRFGLLHSHGFSAGAVSELARTGLGVPHLMTAHDVFLPDMFTGLKGAIKLRALAYLFGRMSSIHAVTEDGAANLRDFMPGLDEGKLRPILHGVDAAWFAGAKPRDVKAELDLPEDALTIAFLGRFMAQKGFRTLVDAVDLIIKERLTSRPVKVLTFGWGGFIREDYAYLESLGLNDHFLQLEATNEPGSWMKSVDVVAMPSRWEACGLLGMEALCAGAPIVGTTCIGLREVLAGSPAPMVKPGDVRGFAEALLETAAPCSRAHFVEYQPIAMERFSVGRPAGELRALYDEFA